MQVRQHPEQSILQPRVIFQKLPARSSKPWGRFRSHSCSDKTLQRRNAESRVVLRLLPRRGGQTARAAAPFSTAAEARSPQITLDAFLAFAGAIFPAIHSDEAPQSRLEFERLDALEHADTLNRARIDYPARHLFDLLQFMSNLTCSCTITIVRTKSS